MLNREDFEVFAMRTWATWSERQHLLHEKERTCAKVCTDWSVALLRDYQEARKSLHLSKIVAYKQHKQAGLDLQ